MRSLDFEGVVTCSPDDSLSSIFSLIRIRRVHRLIVVAGRDEPVPGALIGVITLSDIMKALMVSFLCQDGVHAQYSNGAKLYRVMISRSRLTVSSPRTVEMGLAVVLSVPQLVHPAPDHHTASPVFVTCPVHAPRRFTHLDPVLCTLLRLFTKPIDYLIEVSFPNHV